MCHSVEIYLPRVARDATEHRLGAADRVQAARERAAVDRLAGFFARLRAVLATARQSVQQTGRAR